MLWMTAEDSRPKDVMIRSRTTTGQILMAATRQEALRGRFAHRNLRPEAQAWERVRVNLHEFGNIFNLLFLMVIF